MGIVLNYCQYGVLYLGSHYNNFPHFGNINLGKLPYTPMTLVLVQALHGPLWVFEGRVSNTLSDAMLPPSKLSVADACRRAHTGWASVWDSLLDVFLSTGLLDKRMTAGLGHLLSSLSLLQLGEHMSYETLFKMVCSMYTHI